jgi:hypothetical protein
LNYVDDVGGNNQIKDLLDEDGNDIDGDEGTGVV